MLIALRKESRAYSSLSENIFFRKECFIFVFEGLRTTGKAKENECVSKLYPSQFTRQ